MKVSYEGKTINKEKGWPQGLALSPFLWNVCCADLIKDLENIRDDHTLDGFLQRPLPKPHVRAFADDLTVICYGDNMLRKVWKTIKKWSKDNRVPLNISKSSVLQVKKDQRTPDQVLWTFEVPLVKEMKYLGIWLRDDLSLKTLLRKKKEEEKN
jgi:hypothetical protein